MITIRSTSEQLSRLVRLIAGFNLLVLALQQSGWYEWVDRLPRGFVKGLNEFLTIFWIGSLPVLLLLACMLLWRHIRRTSRRSSTDLALDLGLVSACYVLTLFFGLLGYIWGLTG